MDSINNLQETGMPEEDNNLGMGRSYECVFCKRGFNTAQALGGHMNIHRKDRARNKPASSTNSSKQEENGYMVQSLLYQQRVNPTYQQHYAASHEASQLNNRRSSFAASGSPSSSQPVFGNHHYDAQHFNPYGVDIHWNMSFGLPCGTSAHVEDFEKVRRVGGQEDELDLELRLGH